MNEWNETGITREELNELSTLGLTESNVKNQLAIFKRGGIPVYLVEPATVGNGIKQFTGQEEEELTGLFSNESATRQIIKFVPASGASTRMFKSLLAFFNEYDENKGKNDINALSKDLKEFFQGLKEKHFAFYNDLAASMEKDGKNIENELSHGNYYEISRYLLTDCGLNYSGLPKALIRFHKYGEYVRTPIDEHILEGIAYASNMEKVVNLHFTISRDIEPEIVAYVNHVRPMYEVDGIRLNMGYSFQEPSTGTISVDMENGLFRDRLGHPVVRPGGHGVLIENLQKLNGDVVFIKNIDNTVHGSRMSETVRYKKILAGYLLKIQSRIFEDLQYLTSGKVEESKVNDIADYSRNTLNIRFPEGFINETLGNRIDSLVTKLNRPIRVCGMVKNQGEPGGGPFWIRNDMGISLQIVEEAEVDKQSPEQLKILKSSTHFNPVDIVCGLKNYKGEAFDLSAYIDRNRYFISEKSLDGKPLKALEYPGLWNGSMSDWITLFVEVPLITFNPVKTVNDLLRREHLPV